MEWGVQGSVAVGFQPVKMEGSKSSQGGGGIFY